MFSLRSLGIVAFAWLCATVAVAADPPTDMHLYLLIGQSNMAGRGEIAEQDRQPHARVFMFTKANAWAPAVDPLHFDKPIAGVSLGSTFGRVMADADEKVTIGLIPCAVGGTPLQRWQKDGDLYKQAVARAKLAQKHGTLKGILWHQGESDSGDKATAESYGQRLAEMIEDLRQELDAPAAPFVAGKLGEFLAEKSAQGKPSYWKVVNEQIDALPKTVSHSAVVDSSGLKSKASRVHFDAPSLREFGRRYAAEMQKLQAKQ
jgi:hypothetical protein